jgi:dTDP-4-dehydrorhamnose reductase
MKILITGKTGYIATSLYHVLSNKYEVTTIGREDFNLTNNADTATWFKDKYFDIVIHTAITGGSRLKEETKDTLSDNLLMFFNLLDNKNSFNKLITFGSGAQNSLNRTMYGLSKHIIDRFIRDIPNFFNLNIYGVFDENENETRFIKTTIKNYINKHNIIIHQNKQMDFIYMPDLIQIVEYVINNSLDIKSFDCTYSEKYTLLDVANFINTLNTYKVTIDIQQHNTVQSYIGSPCPFNLNFIGLKQGIQKCYLKIKDCK